MVSPCSWDGGGVESPFIVLASTPLARGDHEASNAGAKTGLRAVGVGRRRAASGVGGLPLLPLPILEFHYWTGQRLPP